MSKFETNPEKLNPKFEARNPKQFSNEGKIDKFQTMKSESGLLSCFHSLLRRMAAKILVNSAAS
jgi:hypothetical protein